MIFLVPFHLSKLNAHLETRVGLLAFFGTTLFNQTRIGLLSGIVKLKLKTALLNPRLSSPSSDQLQLLEVYLFEYSWALS